MDTKKLRQKILDLAIHGKLVPQDPNDEPASVLLERIKAEKEQLIKEGKIKRQKKSASSDTSHYGNDVPFEVPEGWVWCRLGDVLSLISGQDFPPEKYNSLQAGIPYITGASNLVDNEIMVNRWTEYPSVISENGDLLVVCKGAGVGKMAENSIGKAHIARQIQAVRNTLHILLPKYVRIVIEYNIQNIIAQANGLIPGLKRETLLALLIPIPPIEEQKRIVDEVVKWFIQIDAIEQDSSDLKDAVQKAKSKILDLALSGKLTSDTSHYPQLPDGWGNKDFSQLFEVLTSKSYQIQQKEIHQSGKYPVISQSALYIEGYSDIEEKLYNAETPVIIFGDHTRNVKYVNFDFIVGADGVKILKPTINSKFAYYLTLYNSKQIENRGYSRHFQYLKQQSWSIPSEKEQQKIVEIIEHYFRVFDIIITELGDLRYCQ